MKPVRPSDRGPAVEDIQRRLLALGYELGPTGVDGVFLGLTTDAVRSFQRKHDLEAEGIVDDETWSALVDAGFTLGDRMLYLRMPYFHGRDVRLLQKALTVLGFACGAIDGIFGSYTERAVRDFQHNTNLPADGIVGPETVRTITNLRHVWEGKEPAAHSAAHIAGARAAEVLAHVAIAVVGDDDAGRRVAERLVNLAHASTPHALMRAIVEGEALPSDGVVLRLRSRRPSTTVEERPLVKMDGSDLLAARLVTAFATLPAGRNEVVVETELTPADDERADQRAAVTLLDAVCAAFD